MASMVRRNLDLTERMEENTEQQRRVDVARELLEGNIQRQRNADLQDDGQLMALVVRTMQRRIMDVVGMTPAEYRALFTRDL